jgi:hypothetical protein
MAQTQDDMLALLKAKGVEYQCYDHAAVMTCEAQVRPAAALLAHVDGAGVDC